MFDLTRRGLLLGGLATATLGGAVPRALAASSTSTRRFLFVFAPGGWDTTRVFAPLFGRESVDLELDATEATAGGIRYVDHPSRPSVRAFFERHHARSLVLNGIDVPSINHDTCTQLLLTGEARVGRADWGARLADAASGSTTLPHLVLGGPSFPGPYAASVAQTGAAGQLELLLSGDLADLSTMPTDRLSPAAESLVDRFLQRRSGARVLAARSDREAALLGSYGDALDRAVALKDLRYTTDFTTSTDLVVQAEVAVEALSTGLSRCASIAFTGGTGWDTHVDNDAEQARLFEGLFDGLDRVMALLDATPGTAGGTLADETVVVVLSEMGRTPKLNGVFGKDHWPSTSALLVGPGLTTDRVVGGWDDGLFGRAVDLGSGDLASGGLVVQPQTLGATLLALGDVDPASQLPGVQPLSGVLA